MLNAIPTMADRRDLLLAQKAEELRRMVSEMTAIVGKLTQVRTEMFAYSYPLPLLRLRTSAPRERSSPATETAGTCAAKAAQSTPPSESYGTVPLRSARVVSSVTWSPLSVVPTLRTRIVPSKSSTLMPMINIAFIIRLDPERIIVAPKLIPRPQQLRR